MYKHIPQPQVTTFFFLLGYRQKQQTFLSLKDDTPRTKGPSQKKASGYSKEDNHTVSVLPVASVPLSEATLACCQHSSPRTRKVPNEVRAIIGYCHRPQGKAGKKVARTPPLLETGTQFSVTEVTVILFVSTPIISWPCQQLEGPQMFGAAKSSP